MVIKFFKKFVRRKPLKPVKKPRPKKAKACGTFEKIKRKPFKVPSTWKKLDTLALCREAGITRKLGARGWLQFAGGLETYINPRIKSALGYAHYERGTIELNQRYFRSDAAREKMLQTFVHEVAHHLAHEFLEERGHGKAWKETMEWLGYKPQRLGH